VSACVAARAKLHPDAPAIIEGRAAGSRTWTWAEFDHQVGLAAAGLVRVGVGAGERVAVALPNSAENVITVHGAWRLGATVAPLDPRLPENLRDRMGKDLDATMVVHEFSDLTHTSNPWTSFRVPDPHSVLLTAGTIDEPRLAVQSGSIWGRLDGVPDRLREGYGLADRQTQLVTLPLHHGFGHGYAHQYGIAFGHCLVLQQPRVDPGLTCALIERHRVQYLATVPTLLKRIAQASELRETDLSSLEAIMHGASPCPAAVKSEWISRLGPERVYEAYGATEVSIDCTIRGDDWLHRPGSVGRPVGGVIEIRSEDDGPRRIGETGNIVVRPVDRRAAHPKVLGTRNGSTRGFRPTGDVGYLDEDGYLFVVGRSATQLLSGGVTIHVERVEACMEAHPSVREAAIVARPDEDLGEVPHGLVCLEPDSALPTGELLSWCHARLTPDEVPRTVEFVDRLPRTPIGKIDRRGLGAAEAHYSPGSKPPSRAE